MKGLSKSQPQRSCVACRQVKTKRELIRLVRAPEGTVEVDPTGKKKGRGAYLCSEARCWETGLAGGRLEQALRSGISPENREQLMKCGKGLFVGGTSGRGK